MLPILVYDSVLAIAILSDVDALCWMALEMRGDRPSSPKPDRRGLDPNTAAYTIPNGRPAFETDARPGWIWGDRRADFVKKIYGIKPKLARTNVRISRQILTISRAVILSADVPG